MLWRKAIKIKSPAQSGTFFINNNGNTCGDGANNSDDVEKPCDNICEGGDNNACARNNHDGRNNAHDNHDDNILGAYHDNHVHLP